MRASIKEIRRRELVEAARDVISENGYEKTTIAKIAERAGFSVGYLHHHFSSKDQLLLELIRVINAEMHDLLVREFPNFEEPLDRILLILEANIGPNMFKASNAPAWMSFLARTRHDPEFSRMYEVLYRRMRSNLLPQLRVFLSQASASKAADDLYAMIDGYWVRLAALPDSVSSEAAMEGSIRHLDRLLDGKLARRYRGRFRHRLG